MRVAVVISGLFHAGLLALGLVALPHAASTPVELPPVLPVELLTIAEETNVAPAIEVPPEEPEPEPEPEPQPVAEKPKAPDRPQPAPAPPVTRPEPTPEIVPEPEPEPAPPEIVEAEPEPLPEPPKPVVEPVEEPDPAPPTPPADMAAKVTPKPAPVQETAPDPEPDPPKTDDFFSQTAALLDKHPEEEKERVFHRGDDKIDVEQDEKSRAAAGLQSDLTLSEIDAIRAQLKPCWSPPTGAPNAEDLIVVLRVNFNPDGSVIGVPQVIGNWLSQADSYMRAATDRAIRAVLQCQPFQLPAERYRSWRTVDLEFDPRFLLGQ